MIRRPPRSTQSRSSAASDVYKRQAHARRIAECHDVAHEVFATINRDAGPELLSLDLTMGQFKAMATVTMYGPQPVGELGRRLGLSEPAASLLVDKLVELGLAVRERDPQDGGELLGRRPARGARGTRAP